MKKTNESIYRQEALSYANERFYGRILLVRPLSFTVLTLFFMIIILFIMAIFSFFSFSRKTEVPGVILPEQGLIKISSNHPGIITHIYAREGQEVKKGDVLFSLSAEESPDSEIFLLARKKQLSRELDDLSIMRVKMRNTLHDKILELKEEGKLLDELIIIQKERVAITKDFFNKHKSLLSTGAISETLTQEKRTELLQQQANLINLQRERQTIIKEQKSTQVEMDTLDIDIQRDLATNQHSSASVQQNLAEINTKKHIVIEAVQSGVLSGITVEVGETVAAQQLLANMSPKDSLLEAVLYVTPQDISFLRSGMKVLIRYQAYPYQKFGQFQGVVREISHSVLLRKDLALPIIGSDNNTEIFYRVRVELAEQYITAYGQKWSIKPGMTLNASILLEQRKIYEWVLEPLYSISGTL